MNQNGQPRPERVKNGAGVACKPKIRAAFRLKAFETWPGAYDGPSDGRDARELLRELRDTDISGPREFGAGAVAAKQQTHSTRCVPMGHKSRRDRSGNASLLRRDLILQSDPTGRDRQKRVLPLLGV